jgi:DNA-binding GntR family transcriptional regulator
MATLGKSWMQMELSCSASTSGATHSQNRGFSVPRFAASDRAQIDEVRLLLETRALELARGRATAADSAELQHLRDELVRLFREGELPARDAAEIRFHGRIWELSGNPWLAGSLKRAMIPYFTYSRAIGAIRDDLSPGLASERHQLYVDYVAGRTNQSAVECVRFHLGINP